MKLIFVAAILLAACGQSKPDNSKAIDSLNRLKIRKTGEIQPLQDSVNKYDYEKLDSLPLEERGAALTKWGYYSKQVTNLHRDTAVIRMQIDSLR